MRELRVAIVMPGFPVVRDEPGLAAVVDLVERLAAQHKIEVITLRYPASRRAYNLAGARVRPLGLSGAAGVSGRLRVMARAVRAIRSLHRRRPFDVVHGLWADEAGAAASVAARMVGRPSIVSVMGGELVAIRDIGYGAAAGRGGRWTVRISLRLASALTVGSTYLREQVVVHRPAVAVELHPLGVDLSKFRPDGAAPPRQSILFAGSLEPIKDPLAALRAFALLAEAHPDTRLVVAGSGSLRSALERAAGDLGIRDRVEFLGPVRRERMPEVYRAASVLCVTSRHEAQSMVAVEAAACGVPVVGTAVGVLPDLGDAALTVPLAHPPVLADVLARVLDDPALAARMAAAGRRAATTRYDIEQTSESMLDLYDAVVNRPPDAPRDT